MNRIADYLSRFSKYRVYLVEQWKVRTENDVANVGPPLNHGRLEYYSMIFFGPFEQATYDPLGIICRR